MIKFGIRFPENCFESFFNNEVSSQIYIKIKEIDYLLQIHQFIIDYIQEFHQNWWKKL